MLGSKKTVVKDDEVVVEEIGPSQLPSENQETESGRGTPPLPLFLCSLKNSHPFA